MADRGITSAASQTLHLMQRDYVYPKLADRLSPKEWAEVGKPDLIENAIKRKREILDAPRKAIIDPVADKAIRKKFNIHF